MGDRSSHKIGDPTVPSDPDSGARRVVGTGGSPGGCCICFDDSVGSPCLTMPAGGRVPPSMERFMVEGCADGGCVVQVGTEGSVTPSPTIDISVVNRGRGGGVRLVGLDGGVVSFPSLTGRGAESTGDGLALEGCVRVKVRGSASGFRWGFHMATGVGRSAACVGVLFEQCMASDCVVGFVSSGGAPHRNNRISQPILASCAAAFHMACGKRTFVEAAAFSRVERTLAGSHDPSQASYGGSGLTLLCCQDMVWRDSPGGPVVEVPFPESGAWTHNRWCQPVWVSIDDPSGCVLGVRVRAVSDGAFGPERSISGKGGVSFRLAPDEGVCVEHSSGSVGQGSEAGSAEKPFWSWTASDV